MISVLVLASMALALPTSSTNAISISNLMPQNDTLPNLPPANRTLIEQMDVQATDDGILPECYKKCMKGENGKADTDINVLTVEGWCYNSEAFVNAQSWLNQHVLPCVKYECAYNMAGKVSRARAWMRDTCGPPAGIGTRQKL